ncbi:MAG TPA: uracil phosphoribosyltransferase [Elusimicrobia bacterium]|nr:uracil phosphoribosyltransferase [Elusimicrobiota bacterium]
MSKLIVCDHPVLQHALAGLRDKATPRPRFKELMENAGLILGLEALKGVKTQPEQVATPLKTASARKLGQPAALVAILRAGLGMMPGLSRILPEAREGHIGLYRNEETLNPIRYYVRLPAGLDKSFVLLLDPMLATGGSAAEAVRILKTDGAKDVRLVTLLATRTGIRRVHREHPDVHIFTAAVDPVLNTHGYIVPGLGDAGDRLFTV